MTTKKEFVSNKNSFFCVRMCHYTEEHTNDGDRMNFFRLVVADYILHRNLIKYFA